MALIASSGECREASTHVQRIAMAYKEDYQALDAQYLDPNSLMYQKMRLVDRYISKANTLLDIGTGTGELIELEKHKFKRIWGIDTDAESIEICRRRFDTEREITLMECSLISLESRPLESVKFDYAIVVHQILGASHILTLVIDI